MLSSYRNLYSSGYSHVGWRLVFCMINPGEIAKYLFKKHYAIDKNEISLNDVLVARNNRFQTDPYWKIWKQYGEFFGFVEGFFHKLDGTNQLYKIPESERQIFTSPSLILSNFSSGDDLAKYLKSNKILRMVNQSAKNIYTASQILLPQNKIPKPNSIDDLMKFSGYGRKIANMTMNLVFDIPRIAIDVRVFRAAITLGLLPESLSQNLKSDKNKLLAENILHQTFQNSIFLIEMDYLLFCEGGKAK